MTESGQIIKLHGEFATVRIGRNSACGSCGMCTMTENQKHVDFHVKNTLDAKVNDVVLLDIKETNTLKLAAVAYLIPLALAVLFFFVGVWLTFPDWANLLMFVGGGALAFVVVALIDRKMRHTWIAAPEMVQIINRINGGEDNGKSNDTQH